MAKSFLFFPAKLFMLLFVLLLGIVSAFYAAGPAILERAVISRMHSAGLENPEARILSVTHKGIQLSSVTARKPEFHIESMFIDFSPAGLLQGRVDAISISGLKYRIQLGENGPDLGLPDSGVDPAPDVLILPFENIEVMTSFLVLNHKNKDYVVPFSLRAQVLDGQSLAFSARPLILGQPLQIEGQSNIMTMETGFRVRASWPEFLGPGGFFQGWKDFPQEPRGVLNAEFNLEWTMDSQGRGRGTADLEAHVRGLHLRGPKVDVELEKSSFNLRAGFDDEYTFHSLDAEFSLDGLGLNRTFLDNLSVTLTDKGSLLEARAGLSSPVTARFQVRGEQSSINHLLEDDAEYRAELEWDAFLEIDQATAGVLGPARLEAGRSVQGSARGSIRAGYSPLAHAGSDNWFVQVSGYEAKTGLFSLLVPEYGFVVRDASLEFPFVLEAGPGLVRGMLLEKSSVRAGEAFLEHDFTNLNIRDIYIKGQPGSPAAVLEGGTGRTGSLAWAVELGRGFAAILDHGDILVRNIKTSGRVLKEENHGLKADIRIMPEIDLVRINDFQTEITDIRLDIPITIGKALPGPGFFNTGDISYSEMIFPGISGQIAAENHQLHVSGLWPFLPGAELAFLAELSADPARAPAGVIRAGTGWFDFPDMEVITGLIPALNDFLITASARSRFDLSFGQSGVETNAVIEFREADIVHSGMDLQISGINGALVMDDIFSLTTPGNQRIDVKRLKIGELELMDGYLSFRLESRDGFFLERTRWHLPEGGFMAAHSSRFDLREQSADLEFFFEDIDFLKLVSRLTREKIVGSGLIYGRVPLVYDQGRVSIGQGYLYSVPGTGRLGIRDEEWLNMLLMHVREAMSEHPYLSLVSQRLEQALRDFEYNYLTINLKPGPRDTAARIELRGKGVEGDPPQEIGSLVVNVNDLGEIINRVLRFQMSRDESIERALEDLFGF